MTDFVKSTNFASKDSLASGNPLKIVKGTEIDTEFNNIATAVATKADLNNPTFIGTPVAPTASAGTNTTQVATTAFVIADTLAERTATVTLTNKTLTSPTVSSPTMTGTPVAPTAALNTYTTQIATTAFVIDQIADDAPTKSGTGAIGNWGINITGSAATATTAGNVIGASQTWQNVSRTSNTWYQNTTARAIQTFANYNSFSSGLTFYVNQTTPDFTGSTSISFSDGDSGDSGDYGIIIVPIGAYYTCDNWGTAKELR
jgi:hypothetical protein